MITLISTPEPLTSPALESKWLATESPNNFRLQRKDFVVTASAENTGSPAGCLTVTVTSYTGNIGNDILIHDVYNDAIYTGKVIDIAGSDLITDIPYVATQDIDYLNDNTLHGGYYFEGRLTINDIVQTLTIKASPDIYGKADLDVSGILRIMTTLGKAGDYSTTLMKETNKSGKFTLEYRECWYGSSEEYAAEGNDWYYVEAVRSEEQGSNLYEYVTHTAGSSDLQITIKKYNSENTLLGTDVQTVAVSGLEGFLNSLKIDPDSIEDGASYMTVETDRDIPFFNSFEEPVYFLGLPFDISFIHPVTSMA